MAAEQDGKSNVIERTESSKPTGPEAAGSLILVLVALLAAVAMATAASAAAGEGAQSSSEPSEPAPLNARAYEVAAEGRASGGSPESTAVTDEEAAEELPSTELDRGEAVELMNSVFHSELAGSAGIFDDLNPERFDTDYGAVVSAPSGSVLLGSTVPLRKEDAEGDDTAVDLTVEPAEGELQPANPLVEVGIPKELGEGISLPEFGLDMELLGVAEERSPTVVDNSVAIYPNVRPETDLAIAPTPLGVETSTELRSPAAATTEKFRLDLAEGESLLADGEGATVRSARGTPLVALLPPTAIDATGESVPVTMSVAEDVLTLQVHPEPGSSYPILVDPIAEGFGWFNGHTTVGLEDWTAAANSSAYKSLPYTYYYSPAIPGLDMTSGFPGAVPAGTQTNWNYYVPRYWQETPKPTSYITAMWLSDLVFLTNNNYEANPYFVQGLWDGTTEWWRSEQTMSGTSGERTDYSIVYSFYNESPLDEHVKAAGISLVTLEGEASAKYRTAYVGMATIALGDHEAPKWATAGETPWVNAGPASLPFRVADSGLGVQRVKAKEVTAAGGTKTLSPAPEVTLPCSGLVASPCPASYESGAGGEPKFEMSTSGLEGGVDTVRLVASDPVGNESEVGKVQVKVDHTAPELVVGGTITEEAKLGTHLAGYGITVEAKDGTTEHPQSGVALVEVKVDGTLLKREANGCPTRNCSLKEELSLEAAKYANGTHTLEVIAEDAVHLKTVKKVSFEITHDVTEPLVTASGSLMGAPEGWVEQRGYGYSFGASDAGGSGVKALTFKVDGKEVKGTTAPCPKGSCALALSGELNMAKYAGGTHVAELVATDSAGNAARKTWNLNVDPSGTVTTPEAAATLEALDETSAATVVASSAAVIPPAEVAAGNDPKFEAVAGALMSTGTDDLTTVEGGAEAFSVETPTATLEVEAAAPAGQGNSPQVINGVAATVSNDRPAVDSVTRPTYNGLMTYEAIREAAGTSTFEWNVVLGEGQYLEQLSSEAVGLYFENGEEAFLISAEPAADAIGTHVPTTLALREGDVIVLHVELGGGLVYPVQAGTGWEGGFSTEAITPPKTQHEKEEEERKLREEEERRQREESEHAYTGPNTIVGNFGPPELVGEDEKSPEGETLDLLAKAKTRRTWFEFELCMPVLGCSLGSELGLEGYFWHNQHYAWWYENKMHPRCPVQSHVTGMTLTYCNWEGPNHQSYGNGYHITALAEATQSGPVGSFTEPEHLAGYLYGDGNGSFHDTNHTCNPLSVCE
jgi:hypothetical protein